MEERKKVVIDAGHGGIDPGAIYDGREEKNDNLNLSLAVGQRLEENGVDVVFTRVTDVYNTPMEKAQIANRSGADYFVSIHRNATVVPGTASGVMSLVYRDTGVPAQMARNINAGLEEVGFNNLGVVERPGIIVLRYTNMPAVLAEVGFIDNDNDNRLFDQRFPEIAVAIANGILTTIREQEEQQPVFYQVQVGAFTTPELATQLRTQLETQGFPAWIKFEDGLYKVRVGAFVNVNNAIRMEQDLRNYGYDTYMVRE